MLIGLFLINGTNIKSVFIRSIRERRPNIGFLCSLSKEKANKEALMDKLLTGTMYFLWTLSLIGILIITFTNFQYSDLNAIVAFLFFLAILNTFFTLKKR